MAAGFKEVKNVKAGKTTYFVKKTPVKTESETYDYFTLYKKTKKKTSTVAKNMLTGAFSNGSTLCYLKKDTLYGINLKTGKTEKIFSGEAPFDNAILGAGGGYLYVNSKPWLYAVNVSTKEAVKLSWSAASSTYRSIVIYKGRIYEIGDLAPDGELTKTTLNCFSLDGKTLFKSLDPDTQHAGWSDIKIYKGKLYVTKFKSSKKGTLTQYRVFKTDASLSDFKPVTGWVKKVPKQYRSI